MSFDFSFILYLSPPKGMGSTITRKVFQEWANSTPFADAFARDRLFCAFFFFLILFFRIWRLLVKEKGDKHIPSKILTQLIETLKSRYKQYADYSKVFLSFFFILNLSQRSYKSDWKIQNTKLISEKCIYSIFFRIYFCFSSPRGSIRPSSMNLKQDKPPTPSNTPRLTPPTSYKSPPSSSSSKKLTRESVLLN